MESRIEFYYDGSQFDWFSSRARDLFSINKGDTILLKNGRLLEVSKRIHTVVGSYQHTLQIHFVNAPSTDKARQLAMTLEDAIEYEVANCRWCWLIPKGYLRDKLALYYLKKATKRFNWLKEFRELKAKHETDNRNKGG